MRRMYSENQIKKIVSAAPEAIKEALVNQDLKVKTIEQSEANFAAELNNIASLPEGVTLNMYYEGVKVINGILYVVVNCSLTNTTESSVSMPNNWLNITFDISKYASKIYRRDGQSIDNAKSATNEDNFIAPLYTKRDIYLFIPNDLGAYLDQWDTNKIRIAFAGGFNIAAGSTMLVSGRTFLTLI